MLSNVQNKIKTEHRVWYLLLFHCVPLTLYDDENSSRHFKIVCRECKKVGVIVRRLYVHWPEKDDVNGRYLFRFRYYKRNDSAAIRFGESFLYGLSLVGGSNKHMEYEDSLVLRVPDSVVSGRDYVSLELVDFEESRFTEDRMVDYPNYTIGICGATTPDRFEAAWRIAPVTFRNNPLFEATRFIKRSFDCFDIFPGQLAEALSDQQMAALTSSDQTRFEDSLQNAFKAIEAIIGDPPKDDNKFFIKLRQIGLDPNEIVGYRNRKAIHKVIRDMNRARDKKAAHGSTKNRAIYVSELIEFQSCCALVIQAAIEAARGSAIHI